MVSQTPPDKNLDQLVEALNRNYGSGRKLFWRGFIWGLGKGIGNLVGWLLLLTILIFLFQRTGLDETFKDLLETLQKISNSVRSAP